MGHIFNSSHLKLVRRKLRREQPLAERVFWGYLKRRQFLGLKFRRQHSIGPYIVDFYCPELRLVVEVDGASHLDDAQRAHDLRRYQYFVSLGLHQVRFRNDEILYSASGTLNRLRFYIQHHPQTPPRVRRGVLRADNQN